MAQSRAQLLKNLEKARAARKKPVKKTAKKRVGTSQTKPSMLTKKPPSKRLKKRRSKNTASGYYPNPAKKSPTLRYGVEVHTIKGVGYLSDWPKTGPKFDKEAKNALVFVDSKMAKNMAHAILNIKPYGVTGVRVVSLHGPSQVKKK